MSTTHSESYEKARLTLERYNWRQVLRHVVCPAWTNFKEAPPEDFGAMFFHPATAKEQGERIAAYRATCEIPPLVCSDLEAGPAAMIKGTTDFPSMFGCGVAGNEQLAYEMGRCAALESRALGFNWTLAPVCDIALEIDSPVVSQRAAGQSPDQVITATTAYIRGLQDHGMAATAKHFPGDGFSTIDQHLATPVNRMSKGEWEVTYGRTFGAAIKSKVACIMPGHIGLTWADNQNEKFRGAPPATISKRILTGLLREQMGFDGVIVSDAMCMGGVAGFMNHYEACAAFLEAGGDCLLFVRYDSFFEQEMERCLKQGLLQEETLYKRALRLLALKERFGILKNEDVRPELPPREIFQATSEAMSRECIRVVRDRGNILPVSPRADLKLLHVCVCNEYANPQITPKLEQFTKELGRYTNSVTSWVDPGSEKLFLSMRAKEFDLVVVSLWNQPDYAVNVVRLHGPIARNMMDGWMHMGVPVVFVAHAYPFHHHHYHAPMDTVINTYKSTMDSVRFVADGIFGKIKLQTLEE